jgi:hypothetical protein
VVEDRGDSEIVRQGDGAIVERSKRGGSIPRHLGHALTDRAGWFGIFNRDPSNQREVVVDAAILGIPPSSRLCDVWNSRDIGELRQPLRQMLPPDEVLFVRYG